MDQNQLNYTTELNYSCALKKKLANRDAFFLLSQFEFYNKSESGKNGNQISIVIHLKTVAGKCLHYPLL